MGGPPRRAAPEEQPHGKLSGDAHKGPGAPLTMEQRGNGLPLEPQEERQGLGTLFPPNGTTFLVGPLSAELQRGPVSCSPSPEEAGAPRAGAPASTCRGRSNCRSNGTAVPPEGPSSCFLRLDDATLSREWISPVYEHILPTTSESGRSRDPSAREPPLGIAEQAEGGRWPRTLPSVDGARVSSSPACWHSTGETDRAAEQQQAASPQHDQGPLGCPDYLCSQDSESPPHAGNDTAMAHSDQQSAEKTRDAGGTSCDRGTATDAPHGGLRRPCLVLLDLDNTLIPTGWIMACWRKMQVYFGLQQAVACIRKGLEQAELVRALRALFDDLRLLREKRHTQIVIVTNAGLRTVQEFYLKMCLPELKELCEREKVYIHSTEHFARRVGPIPPMTEEEAFCEFYTALKYHEFDFVVQRYLNALLCQAPIPLQGAHQDEEAGAPYATRPCRPGPLSQLEGNACPPRRSAPPFCKRARLSAQRESSATAAGCGSSASSAAACCDWCSTGGSLRGAAGESSTAETPGGEASVSPPKAEALAPPSRPPPLQQPGHACCCSSAARAQAETAEGKQSAPLTLRDQLQAAAAAYVQAEGEKKDSSPAPSPSKSPRGFDPFPLDWRCDLISAGDQVCEIHAACRVARHFAGHVKFAKLLFLRDPEDPRFLAQTPTRFIAVREHSRASDSAPLFYETAFCGLWDHVIHTAMNCEFGRRINKLEIPTCGIYCLQQLRELHASLLHVLSCDEETLDERGRPRWVRRGSFSQVTIVAPERLEAPPRHCAVARVKHAFEYLRRRRTKSSKASASASFRLRQDLALRQTDFGADSAGQGHAELAAAKRHNLSCPLEWERNAVANPPSTPPLCALHNTEMPTQFNEQQSDAPDNGQLAVASESRST